MRLDEVERLEARFAPPPAQDQPVTDRCIFRHDGNRWHYTFRGKSGSCRPALGFAYVGELLRREHQRIDVVDLQAAVSGGGAPSQLTRSRGETIADDRMISELKQRRGRIARDLEAAREGGDQPTIERLEDEQRQLAQEAKKLLGLHGRPRRMADEVDKARKRVREAVTLAYKAIAEDHPELADHLRRCITLGASPVYQPPPSEAVAWDV